MTIELANSLLRFIAPEVVVQHFELVKIEEYPDHLILEFEEFSHLVPQELSGSETKLDGFTNKIELHTFPQKGKICYLQIKRRKWTDKITGKTYTNNYEFHKEGMKATDELGAFLKKNNRGRTNKF